MFSFDNELDVLALIFRLILEFILCRTFNFIDSHIFQVAIVMSFEVRNSSSTECVRV